MGPLLEAFAKLPNWQRLLVFLVGLGVIGALWYLLFYSDALEQRASAETALQKAQAEVAKLEKEKQQFLERQRKQAELETELNKKIEVLPMSIASVDHLMQTFQQQARLVGMTVESWSPEGEQREDYYARLPVKVKATGTWTQAGEFFRRVSELDRIVSIDNVSMVKGNATTPDGKPLLNISFEAATYRFLSEDERKSAPARGARGGSRRK